MKKAKCTLIAGLFLFQTGAMAQVYVKNTGNVGIGTNSPDDKLHVNGNLRLSPGNEIYFADNGQIRSLDVNHRILFRRDENILELREYGRIIFSAGVTNGLETTTMVVNNDGNVGVGVTYPAYKLDVGGTARANEFLAAASGNHYADYVFDSTHQLPTLQSVNAYIKQNHHLPDVPTEADVKKDGINLVDHQVVLLKKIEELTLYVIEQNEKQKVLEEKLNEVLKDNKSLKKEIKSLKAKTGNKL